MSQKIGIISDVHATPAPVEEALSIFQEQGVDRILCAGDIAGYGEGLEQTVELLDTSGCRSILGNHDIWYLEQPAREKKALPERFLRRLPQKLELTVEGKKLYVVHASPPLSLMQGIHLLDEKGLVRSDQKHLWAEFLTDFEYDILIVGHTHQVFAEIIGCTLVINPGSTKFNHTCVVLSLPDKDCRVFALSGKDPLTVWNWGIFRSNG